MRNYLDALRNKSLMLIFAYAPAGFGHLRVTNALYQGLPHDADPILLGAQDKSITLLHRIGSIYYFTRAIYEGMQSGFAEDIMTRAYRSFLRAHTTLLYEQLTTILDQQLQPPETILIVATHFGLAHQIAAIKERLMNERKVRIILVVQVTDDSPQQMWYVTGSDLIFVPSEYTKLSLEKYGRTAGLEPVRFLVNPYPLSLTLSHSLTENQIEDRREQLNLQNNNPINMIIPISGAAVGTEYFTILIDELYKKSHRFAFHVVTKTAPYTQRFIYEMNSRSYVKLYSSSIDKEVIDRYEEVYKQEIISLEITKPSEQSFKALLNCEQRGGSVLLFTEPIGRQEHDNLNFLRRHHLIPLKSEEDELFKLAQHDTDPHLPHDTIFLEKAHRWRGLVLPRNPYIAAQFIWWMLRNSLGKNMVQCQESSQHDKLAMDELGPYGVKTFWEKVFDII